MTSFARIAVVGRRSSPHIADTLQAVLGVLEQRAVEIIVETETANLLTKRPPRTCEHKELTDAADLVIVVGGDGSLLGVARTIAGTGVPVLGVNRGGLGFLADIAPKEIGDKVNAVLDGGYRVEERHLLCASIHRDGDALDASSALNDVVVHAGSMSRMMDFNLEIDGEFVYSQRSDGLIVASPTGSTAYALSAGGPIMHPRLDAFVIVPMFPHTLTSRPLVVPGAAQISVHVGAHAETPKVSCDSQVDQSLRPGDEVRIVKHPDVLHLAFPTAHSFFESCRSKLDWASRLGNTQH